MNRYRLLSLTLALWSIPAWGVFSRAQSVDAPARTPSASPDHAAILKQYCITCHNQRTNTAGISLDTLDLANVPAHADIWEKVLRRLKAGAMPPQGARRPDAATYDELVGWLEHALDEAAVRRPEPGRPLVHRLNRTEYANAIRDVLALDVDAASLLPPDDSAFGFDNVSDALGVSPVLLERYLSAADRISAMAVGDPSITPVTEVYRLRQDLSQDRHVDGLPFGTVGGALVRHTFPLDAEYVLQTKLFRTNTDGTRGLEHPHQLEITVDGARVFLGVVGGETDFRALYADQTPASDAIDARLKVRVPIKAGRHSVGVAFLQKSLAANSRRLQPFVRSSFDTFDYTGLPHISTLAVSGPFDATGPGDTTSRQRIFSCRPQTADTAAGDACARAIIGTIARRAYRQPQIDSADLERLLTFYRAGRTEGGFDTGIQRAIQRILSSPKFIVRVERDPAGAVPGTVYRITDVELASRLSFFLWSSIPDDDLLRAAGQGKLSGSAVLEQQLQRMLADPKSDALVDNFAGQWLYLRNLKNQQPISSVFPDFDDNLRVALARETSLFFDSVKREDRNVLDLLTADYTFVNERLARHYGIPNVYGSQFRRVTVPTDARRGLLGKGAILTVTSHADRTSPVVRGKWILENLLSMPPPPPPENVPALKENEEGQKPRTVREQMAEHRTNPVCASCHKVMDPIGLALENFDAVGAWRTTEAGSPIDATGQLSDGTQVNGVESLRAALLGKPEVFVGTLTEKLLIYALGRGLDHRDMPAVRAIVRDARPHDYRFSSLVSGIVNSVPFRMRNAGGSGMARVAAVTRAR